MTGHKKRPVAGEDRYNFSFICFYKNSVQQNTKCSILVESSSFCINPPFGIAVVT